VEWSLLREAKISSVIQEIPNLYGRRLITVFVVVVVVAVVVNRSEGFLEGP
jgi:hypothetical protein